jgi:hypothetical protein
MLEIVKADTSHIPHLAEHMRPADITEIRAAGDLSPEDALTRGLAASQYCSTALIDGVPVAMFGLRKPSILSETGIVWMLGTDAVYQIKREMITIARAVIAEMLDVCPVLSNMVHSDNVTSIRWLRRMGFDIREGAPVGVDGEIFHRFEMIKGDTDV